MWGWTQIDAGPGGGRAVAKERTVDAREIWRGPRCGGARIVKERAGELGAGPGVGARGMRRDAREIWARAPGWGARIVKERAGELGAGPGMGRADCEGARGRIGRGPRCVGARGTRGVRRETKDKGRRGDWKRSRFWCW